jgi:hypothetical protein
MSSIDIQRVVWTNGSGDWGNAKVRDLVDVHENSGLEQPSDAASALNNVFVTKHEVSMLRQTMADT